MSFLSRTVLFPKTGLFLHARSLFIRTQETPNPQSLKFLPGKPVSSSPIDFSSFRAAQNSGLARRLFRIEGVTSVFLGPDFVTVNVGEKAEWMLIKPDVFAAIQEFFTSGEPVMNESNQVQVQASDTTILPEDSEAVAMIKELIETRIRPTVQEDGGYFVF